MIRWDDMALAGTYIGHSADRSAGRNPVDFAMIWFDGVKRCSDCNHAVPSAVGLEVVRLGVRDRVGHLEGAEVGDEDRAAVSA